jgi:hypothetical protein
MAHMLPDTINHLHRRDKLPENSNEEISQGLSALANGEPLK